MEQQSIIRSVSRLSWPLHSQRYNRLLLILGSLCVLSVLFQLLYPSNRVLPFVSVAGIAAGGASRETVQKKIDATYAKAAFHIKTDDKTFIKSFDEAGVSVNARHTTAAALQYSFVQRTIPFSSVAIMLRREVPPQTDYDKERLLYFAQQLQKEAYVPPVNAMVVMQGKKATLKPDKPSKIYAAHSIANGIKKAKVSPATTVKMQPVIQTAERTDEEVQSVLKQAQKAVDTPLTLRVNGTSSVVSRETIASWLTFPEDPNTKKLHMTLNADAAKKYLDSIQGKAYKAPGVTKVQLVDGVETGRTEGAVGKGIAYDKTVAMLDEALKNGSITTLDLPVADIAPTISYSRSYSNTSNGLAVLLKDLTRGKNASVSVSELSGARSASTNGNRQFEAASTYKLFIAYAVFKQIESGAMHWTDVINGDTTADACFEAMIVKSDNPCAKAFGDKIGWANVQNQMRGLGLGSTVLNGPTLLTTANDLMLYLYKLQSGTLLNGADSTRLIDAMKRQVYRSGIPAGTGAAVADKVGFIGSVIHDAGIVYGPKGPYVLVIMTGNNSWSGVADIARQISSFMNR